jgi:hypothetical protein
MGYAYTSFGPVGGRPPQRHVRGEEVLASSFDTIHRLMLAEPGSNATHPRFQDGDAARRLRLIQISLIILEPSR